MAGSELDEVVRIGRSLPRRHRARPVRGRARGAAGSGSERADPRLVPEPARGLGRRDGKSRAGSRRDGSLRHLGQDSPGREGVRRLPLSFDGPWFDYYLRRFTRYGLVQGPYEEDRLFSGPGLCIRSYAAALTTLAWSQASSAAHLPSEWFGDVPHTHRAIDDALGYANLLVTLARRAQRA